MKAQPQPFEQFVRCPRCGRQFLFRVPAGLSAVAAVLNWELHVGMCAACWNRATTGAAGRSPVQPDPDGLFRGGPELPREIAEADVGF